MLASHGALCPRCRLNASYSYPLPACVDNALFKLKLSAYERLWITHGLICVWIYSMNRKMWVYCSDILGLDLNSLRPSDAYMRHLTKPTLIRIMACRLTGELFNKCALKLFKEIWCSTWKKRQKPMHHRSTPNPRYFVDITFSILGSCTIASTYLICTDFVPR